MTEHVATLHACEETRVKIARFRAALYRWVPILFIVANLLPIIVVFLYLEDTFPNTFPLGLLLVIAAVSIVFICAWWLQKGELVLVCPHCQEGNHSIGSAWVCGNCHRTNKRPLAPTRPTFLEACRFCKQRPSALCCRECSAATPLDARFSATTKPAWLEGYPPQPITEVVEATPPKPIDEDLR